MCLSTRTPSKKRHAREYLPAVPAVLYQPSILPRPSILVSRASRKKTSQSRHIQALNSHAQNLPACKPSKRPRECDMSPRRAVARPPSLAVGPGLPGTEGSPGGHGDIPGGTPGHLEDTASPLVDTATPREESEIPLADAECAPAEFSAGRITARTHRTAPHWCPGQARAFKRLFIFIRLLD